MNIPIGLSRDANHVYTANYPPLEPVVAPGVTGILKVIDKPAIVPWAQGMVAEAAIANRSQLEEWVKVGGVEGAVQLLRRAAETKRDAAANRGVTIHALAASIVQGQPVTIPEDIASTVMGYVKWIERFQPEFLAVEEMVFSYAHNYGGTLDVIAKIATEVWLLDLKSSKGIYPDSACQLSGYGEAEFIGRTGDPRQYVLPHIDQYGIVHVTPEGSELIPYDVTGAEFKAFLAARALHDWRANRSRSVIGQAVGPQLLHFPNPVPEKEKVAV